MPRSRKKKAKEVELDGPCLLYMVAIGYWYLDNPQPLQQVTGWIIDANKAVADELISRWFIKYQKYLRGSGPVDAKPFVRAHYTATDMDLANLEDIRETMRKFDETGEFLAPSFQGSGHRMNDADFLSSLGIKLPDDPPTN